MIFPSAKRILFKISGQFLQGDQKGGICTQVTGKICAHIASLPEHQWVIVVGGGNFFRGKESRANFGSHISDTMGMMATYLNGLALMGLLKKEGVKARIFCARGVEGVGEPFSPSAIEECLANKEVVICAGGLGHGAMTTDTAAVVRACELECDLILKGTRVQGVYDKDPMVYPDASFYKTLTYREAITQKLGILDQTALVLAEENKKPMIVFSLLGEGILSLFNNTIPYTLCS